MPGGHELGGNDIDSSLESLRLEEKALDAAIKALRERYSYDSEKLIAPERTYAEKKKSIAERRTKLLGKTH